MVALAILAAFLAVVAVVGGKLLAPYAVSQIEAYTGTKVTVDSAKFSIFGTLRLRGLKVVTTGPNSSVLLQARKVSAGFGLMSLLKGTPQLKSLTVTGGKLNLEYDPNMSQWNISSLVPKGRPASGAVGVLPRMEIADCLVTLNKRQDGGAVAMLAVPLVFDARTTGRGYEFHMTSMMSAGEAAAAKEPWAMDIKGKVDNVETTGDFSLEVVVHNLILSNEKAKGEMRVGRELAEVLHEELVRLWDKYKPDGNVDVEASLSGSLADITKGRVAATFIFRDVRLKYKYFPYELEHMKGNIFFRNGDLVIEGLTGNHGPTQVTIAGWSRGSGKDWESDVTVHSDNAVIDDAVYGALTPAEKSIWRMFSPSGRVQLDFQYRSQQGQEIMSRATLTLIDAEMMYERFWHRFTNGTGTMTIEPNEVRLIGVTSREQDCVTTFNGSVSNILSGKPDIDIKVRGSGMPISTKLLATVAPERHRMQLGDFDFAGTMDFALAVSAVHKPGWRIDYAADANIVAPELRFVSRDMGLSDVSASVRLTPTSLSMAGIKGKYLDSPVHIGGRIEMSDDPDALVNYVVTIDGNNIDLDKKILSLIAERGASFWDEVKPSGHANIAAKLGGGQLAGQDSLAIDCIGTQAQLTKIGYNLTDMRGKVTLMDNSVQFDHLKANVTDPSTDGEPGNVRINGRIAFAKGKLSELDLGFGADQLRFGSCLRQVIERLSPGLYDPMAPTGTVGIRQGAFRLGVDPNGQRFGDFRGTVAFEDCAFGKDEFSNINGTLQLTGFFEDQVQNCNARGELDVRTMAVRGKQLTDVRGQVDRRKGQTKWSLANVTARCYDGTIAGHVELDSRPDGGYGYMLNTAFSNVNMRAFLTKPGADPNSVSQGIMDGSLVVNGRFGDEPARTGSLKLDVRDMQVGRMSFLAKVLTLLSLSVPGDVAFQSMQMTSRIEGDKITIDDLLMSGDALNFKGAGRIDLASKMVDIDLAATSPTPTPGILTSVMVGLRHAVVYLKVRGQLDDPTVNVTPLPLVDQAIQKVLGTRE